MVAEIVTSTTGQSANWIGIVASSAVISAIVNISWTAIQKYRDQKREDEKKAKTLAHVYLDLALNLEDFVRQCDSYLYKITEGLWERNVNHDESHLQRLRSPEFNLQPAASWNELPVEFIAQIRRIDIRLNSTNKWIGMQWEWADYDEMFTWEEECIAFHGLEICNLIISIYNKISIDLDEEINNVIEHFNSIVNDRRESFKKEGSRISLIPELLAQFSKELPESAIEKEEVDTLHNDAHRNLF